MEFLTFLLKHFFLRFLLHESVLKWATFQKQGRESIRPKKTFTSSTNIYTSVSIIVATMKTHVKNRAPKPAVRWGSGTIFVTQKVRNNILTNA